MAEPLNSNNGEVRAAPAVLRNERRARLAVLLSAGMSYRQMAAELGVSDSTIAGDVKALLLEWQTKRLQSVEELVAVEIRRLDSLLNGVYERAVAGELECIDRCLKIADRRAKLLGLDRAVELSVTLHTDSAAAELDEKLSRMAERLGLRDQRAAEADADTIDAQFVEIDLTTDSPNVEVNELVRDAPRGKPEHALAVIPKVVKPTLDATQVAGSRESIDEAYESFEAVLRRSRE